MGGDARSGSLLSRKFFISYKFLFTVLSVVLFLAFVDGVLFVKTPDSSVAVSNIWSKYKPVQADDSRNGSGIQDNTQKSSRDTNFVSQTILTGVCLEYFHNLYDLNSDWGIEVYGKDDNDEARRNVRASVHHIRAYMNCFLNNNVSLNFDFNDLESRLFPAFTGKLPTFTRWDGFQIENAFPNMTEIQNSHSENKEPEHESEDANVKSQMKREEDKEETRESNTENTEKKPVSNVPFWRRVTESMSGKGIVISLSDKQVPSMKQLLMVFRFLNNELPIQIVHKGDLSEESRHELVTIARNPENDPVLREKAISKGIQLPDHPQELWFVNAKDTIAEPSWGQFDRFNNKWIAMLFNSFDDMIIMDDDAVPFIKPEEFFETPEYKETQAFFFKDRAISFAFISREDQEFLLSLLPSDQECDIFKMNKITKHTYNNPLMRSRYQHVMESGLVPIRRSNHMDGLLMAVSLQLWSPSSRSTYGDKEMFWLGQSVAGNEKYKFNAHTAAALGHLQTGNREFSPQDSKEDDATEEETHDTDERKNEEAEKEEKQAENSDDDLIKRDQESAAKEVYSYNYTCSAQPAHLDSNYKLLWTNSGLQNCKIKEYQNDWNMFEPLHDEFEDIEKYQAWLKSPVSFSGAMIPEYVGQDDVEKFGSLSGFRKTENKGCAGYIWCTYSSEQFPSTWHEFNDSEMKMFSQVSDNWYLLLDS